MRGRYPISRVRLFLLLLCAAALHNLAFGESGPISESTGPSQPTTEQLDANPWLRSLFEPDVAPLHHVSKRAGHYSKADWAAVIDSTWGPGASVADQMSAFREFWYRIDSLFACFQDLDLDWDSVFIVNNLELTTNPSKGRFAGLLNHSAMALRESHTLCRDNTVVGSARAPGVPLMSVGGWNANHHFGAALTPLPDSSLLVYLAMADHPLALVPGDIVLGYDGIPWKELLLELLDAQLPLYRGGWTGTSPVAFTHSLLMAAGLNWHLYDTIDVVAYATGDTLHLPTNLLADQQLSCYGTEQLPIPGIPSMSYAHPVAWGMIPGTKVGYINCLIWMEPAGEELLHAVDTLMFHHETVGLIFESRFNYGGNMFLAHPAFSLLFNTPTETVGFDTRCDPDDHNAMCLNSGPENYIVPADPNTFYDRPIALLTGPGAVSSGDQVPLALSFHPNVRTFGKPTAAAFTSATQALPGDGIYMQYAYVDAWLPANPGHYISRDVRPVDEAVWLTQDGVAEGRDDVIEAAVDWIYSQVPVYFWDGGLGQAPFEVSFEGWSPFEISGWDWDFGDGGSASIPAPTHMFAQRGVYDVTVEAVIDGEVHTYIDTGAVIVVADTIFTDSVAVTEDISSIEVVISATNTIPLNRLAIPFEYSGTLSLVFDSFSTVGCRTDYFDVQSYLHFSPSFKRATIKLETAADGSQEVLAAGSGPVLKIYLHADEGAYLGQEAALSLEGYTNYAPTFRGPQAEYLARGMVALAYYTTCCQGQAGNVDNDSGDMIDIADLVYLVEYMFAQGTEPVCNYEANVDGDIFVDISISDLVFLVDYMFNGGPAPPECP